MQHVTMHAQTAQPEMAMDDSTVAKISGLVKQT